MRHYPVIIFAYNRPKLLSKCLKSIKKNFNYKKHKYFLICDGAKTDDDKNKIKKIKEVVKNSQINFHSTKYKKKNIGLSGNIISGVSGVLKKYPACIVIEDDLILGKNALRFLNYHLNIQKKNDLVGSVSSYSYIHNYKTKSKIKSYLSKRHSSWCWGTWSNVWKKINWSKKYNQFDFNNKNLKENFNNLGKDMSLMLWGFNRCFINSWAIRFNYNCFKKNLSSVQPRYSYVNNLGSGIGATNQKFRKNPFFKNINKPFQKSKMYINDTNIHNFIKNNHHESLRLKIYYLLNKIIN